MSDERANADVIRLLGNLGFEVYDSDEEYLMVEVSVPADTPLSEFDKRFEPMYRLIDLGELFLADEMTHYDRRSNENGVNMRYLMCREYESESFFGSVNQRGLMELIAEERKRAGVDKACYQVIG